MPSRLLVVLLTLLSVMHAEEALDLARIHLEALGGRERIDALRSLRATAKVSIGDRRVEVTIVAQKPNRIRTETRAAGQVITQAYDGTNPPWQFNSKDPKGSKQPLAPSAAEALIADADFLDPLIDWVSRGSSLEFIGRALGYNTIVSRIRVATTGRDLVEVWLDPKTYLITHQLRQRQVSKDRMIVIETHFSDFRPVAGVIMPHRIASYVEGQLQHVTEITHITANPVIPEGCFTAP